MTTYEFLQTHCHTFAQADDMNVKISDVRYLDMYREYNRLMTEGHKKTYVMYYLSEEYSIDERTVYRVISRMEKNLNL